MQDQTKDASRGKNDSRNQLALNRHRERIDELDGRILALLNERMQEALAIGRLKATSGKAVLDSDRERRLLERLHGLNRGPLSNEQLDRIYRVVMEVSRDLQKRIEF